MLEFAHETRPFLVNFQNINPLGCEDFTPLTSSSEKAHQMLEVVTSRNDYPFDIGLPVTIDPESKRFAFQKCPQPWTMAWFYDKGHLAYCCFLEHDDAIGNMFQDYDFNSRSMIDFRRKMIENRYRKDSCLSCLVRFMGQEYGYFHASRGE